MVSVSSMEAAAHGLCAGIQGAPPKLKREVSVASMEATHEVGANIQPAPPEQMRAVSALSMAAARTPNRAKHPIAPPL
jgi:hypothetical protein